MKITDKELNDIYAAADMITNTADGADDHEYYAGIVKSLMDVWSKGAHENKRMSDRKIVNAVLDKLDKIKNPLKP